MKRRVSFQNRCWSPSSANTGPLAGSQNSGSKISTWIYSTCFRSLLHVQIGTMAALSESKHGIRKCSAWRLTMHLFAPFSMARAVASLACCKASPRLSGKTCRNWYDFASDMSCKLELLCQSRHTSSSRGTGDSGGVAGLLSIPASVSAHVRTLHLRLSVCTRCLFDVNCLYWAL